MVTQTDEIGTWTASTTPAAPVVAQSATYVPAAEASRPPADPRPPARAGDVLKQIKEIRFPARLQQRLAEQVEAGRTAARSGTGRQVETDDAAEQVELTQAGARRSALDACLPLNREAALRGFDGLDQDQHPDKLRAWLADPRARTLIMAGRTGSGKTQAAYTLAVEAAQGCGAAMIGRNGAVRTRPLLVRAWAITRYLAELRPDGSPDPGWLTRHKARTAELLILDDLGAETDGVTREFVRTELVQLLDDRSEARLRTIITTNLSSKAIEERFGQRFYSRLVEDAAALTFLGPDRRNLRKLEW